MKKIKHRELALTSEPPPPIVDLCDNLATRKECIRLVESKLDTSFNTVVKKLFLVMPPDMTGKDFDVEKARRRRYRNYPAYGLGLLAAKIRQFFPDIEVHVVNLNHEILKSANNDDNFEFENALNQIINDRISTKNPCFVALTCMFSQTHDSLVNVCNVLRKRLKTVPLGVGGVHVTNSFANEQTRKNLINDLNFCDFFFRYEGEESFIQFLDVINGNDKVESLAQLACRVTNNSLIEFKRKLVPEKRHINIITAHDLLDTKDLSKFGNIGSFYCHKPVDAKFSTVLSNRGCRAQCSFCSVRNFNGVGVRRRSVESVLEELKVLRYEHDIDHIMWLDDDFLYDRAESLKLFNLLIKENLGMTWDCSNGVIAASCKEDVMSAAEEAGCIGLLIGMESGSRRVLREIKKPGTVETFLRAAEVLRTKTKINSRVFLMIGFPGETFSEIYETVSVASQMNLDWHQIAVLQPLPNTPIYESMLAEGLIEADFDSIRWNTGSIGKGKNSRDNDIPSDLQACDFKDAFRLKDMTAIPSRRELDDIWAYMNFHLNFNKLFFERRSEKLRQQYNYLLSLSGIVVPENVFAIYFTAYLQMQAEGKVDSSLYENLKVVLNSSAYWRDRFAEFGLHPDHLLEGKFPAGVDYIRDAIASEADLPTQLV